jgi:Ca2+-binding RTX toxin-like protein
MVWGNRGDDTLLGGTGTDQFHLRGTFGHDTITDFSLSGGDKIVVDAGVRFVYADNGTSTRADFSTGDSVVLIHTDFNFANVGSGSFFEFL